MEREHDDTWDLTTSVGATATMVAAARAAASRRSTTLVKDPFAKHLVQAVGIPFFTRLASGEIDFGEISGGTGWMPALFDLRAWYFDKFLSAAWCRGIRQVVNIGAGLDARAYRLAWPPGTTVYEIDQPEVMAFKNAVITDHGAVPTTELRSVAVDLRHDWSAALRDAGFDASVPTAWLAEGLLIGYLPSEQQDRILDTVSGLSAVGGCLAADYLPVSPSALGAQMRAIGASWCEYGLEVDFGNLYFDGRRTDVKQHLNALGWETAGCHQKELFAAAGVREPYFEPADPQPAMVYLTASRGPNARSTRRR